MTVPDHSKPALVVAGIPAYNEEGTIAKIVVNAKRHVDRLIVVDDGSTDDTKIIAENLGAIVLRHETNRGKGEALKAIFAVARELGADVLVTLDADAQHDPNEIPRVIEPILNSTADVVVGSRRGQRTIPLLRGAGQWFLDTITNVRDQEGAIVDSQSGFRAYSRKAIAQFDFGEAGMGFESESLVNGFKSGLTIKQVPISVKYGSGIKHAINPLLHFSDVIAAITRIAILKRPIRFLGVPAACLVIIGLSWWVRILWIYNETRQFALGNALVASVVLIAGFFLGVASLFLLAIRLTLQETLVSVKGWPAERAVLRSTRTETDVP